MENLDKNHARPALVFLRLIRNAGSTLGSILRRQYGVSSVLEFDSLRDVQKKLTLFEYQPGNEGENIEVFMGSFNFGQLSELPVPGHYLTMLRHPIDRIVSEYEAILNRPEHEMHHRVISNQMSLMAFVRSGISAVIDNYQTRCLCGFDADPADRSLRVPSSPLN